MPTPYLTEDWGWPLLVTVANPAPGAQFTYVLPQIDGGNVSYLLQSASYRLTCSAVVATRFFRLIINDNAGIQLWTLVDSNGVTASQVVTTTYALEGPMANLTGLLDRTNGLLHLSMPNGYQIISAVSNLQAADQIDTIYLTFRVWRI